MLMLEMKNTIIEMKAAVDICHSRLVVTEEEVSGPADKSEAGTHNAAQRKIQKT